MKVMLAIDDSRFCAAAVRMVLAQNPPGDTTVKVLHVVEPLMTPYYPELGPPYPVSLEDLNKTRLKVGRALAARVTKRIRDAGFEAEQDVRLGPARSTIVDVAAKWRADLIVMGSHGRQGLKRILLGSVSEHVARHAPCSVEIVRRASR